MVRSFWSLLLCLMCLGDPAKAHPHVFVDARTGFIFDDSGHLRALHISWTYDEFTTLILFETLSLDKDGDGFLNDEDRAAVIEGETNWGPEYKGDTYLEVAGQDYPLGRPEAAVVTLEKNRLEVSFELPLSQPVTIDSTPAILRLYDPVFYYAYTILPANDGQKLPEDCYAQIISFEPSAAESELQQLLAALSREEMPTQQNVGRLFSDEVRLTCG
ncbi:DUF1007 family protein [Pontibaca salina]|uniref:DUF1007 family protein n=1 Tax=Pontibaca salina TaxID=2795731 RepID=A0A934M1A3_9RHOB|nr:DUF1007 family protein [Pontibaca salina]